MNKIILSLVAIVGMSSTSFASEATEYEPEDKGFYVGLAFSHLSHDIDFESLGTNIELDFNTVMVEAGYKFNPYIAVEVKYNVLLGDTDVDDYVENADVSVLSFFVKPMYPIAPEMDIYVLLGYAFTDLSYSHQAISFDDASFAWGAGASYDMTEDFSFFAEYTQFHNDTLNDFDHVVDSFNIGITYKF